MKPQQTLLRKIRRDRELTIDVLSIETGIDHSTLSLVERRLKTASENVRAQLEKYFGISADLLLADAPDEVTATVYANGHGNRAAIAKKDSNRRKVSVPVLRDRRVNS